MAFYSAAKTTLGKFGRLANHFSAASTSRANSTHSASTLMTRAVTLEAIDRDIFRLPAENLWQPPAGRGVFGGQILAGAMKAATQTTTQNFPIHSLHSFFLLPGDPGRPIIFKVTRLRDGKSFETREVTAVQNGNAIFGAEFSYHKPEECPISHQPQMPTAPAPETLISTHERLKQILQDPRITPLYASLIAKSLTAPFPIDVRPVDPQDPFAPTRKSPAYQLVWIRCTEELGDDIDMHRYAVAYASDWSLAGTMMLPHSISFASPSLRMVASLDHVMYFTAEREFRADEWLLYEMESPVLSGSRGLNVGKIFRRDGQLVATCVQEALIRVKSPTEDDRRATSPSSASPASSTASTTSAANASGDATPSSPAATPPVSPTASPASP